ncbi:hypothetical protein AB1Y20_015138 [Prymnesium parvum]|uniref:tRNA-dihydrouridine(16/17) synthase [NAD(P)(+)] n=1 Tax=Prymnesium parvum TaxID=97485 RepID=A0AB34K0P3_PRYPA
MRGPLALSSAIGWDFWALLGNPKFVAAPMVDQSERPFRLLCSQLGAHLTYTPMLHARLMVEVPAYRAAHFDAHVDVEEGPVFAQLAGHDPPTVLAAARLVEPHVTAVDLNFGCPQGIARKGRYGAFLLEEPETMAAVVKTLSRELTIPVTAKLRMMPTLEDTVRNCQQLEAAGASVLCLHGRTRQQNKQLSGGADWDVIAEVVRQVGVPVIANGGIATFEDVERCLKHTGAAAVMSSEALLENPALFCRNMDPRTRHYLNQEELAYRYLDLCIEHPPSKGAAMMRPHLFKMLHHGLRTHTELRDELLCANHPDELRQIVRRLSSSGWLQPQFHTPSYQPEISWYNRYRGASDDNDDSADGKDDTGRSSMETLTREELEKRTLMKLEQKQIAKRRKRLARKARRAAVVE